MWRATCLGFVGLVLAPALHAQQAAAPTVHEWPVPWANTRPRDPYPASDGSVWLVGQVGNYLARFDVYKAEFARFDLEAGVHPHNVIVDAAGKPWYAGNRAAHIGRFDPASGQTTRYVMPDPAAADPHTLVFDEHGHIWFTVQRGNFIGRLRMRDGHVDLAPVPTKAALPYGIVSTPAGEAWAVLLGTNKLARVAPESMTVEEIELPRASARPRRIARTTDGRIWYVDFREGYLGAYDHQAREFKEWKTPSSNAGPYAMGIDDRDRVWFVETFPQPNLLHAFDPKLERFVVSVPLQSEVVRHMSFDAPRRSFWFGTDTNKLVQVTVPP